MRHIKGVLIIIYVVLHTGLIAQPIYAPQSVDWPLRGEDVAKIPLFALKTNLLYDAIITPNITLELPIGGRWSISAEWIFAWWDDSKHLRCYEYLSGGLQARYWFTPHTRDYPMRGWFVGGYIQAGYYDVERRGRGAQGQMWGMNGVGGYTHHLVRNLRMEYSVALGFINTPYNKYVETLDCSDELVLQRYKKGRYMWWGITRVDISLVWMLYNKRI